MNVLVWHVHGSWLTSFVQGPYTFLVPVTPDRGPDGLGRARTWNWPPTVREAGPGELRAADIDLMVLQRPHELELAHAWTGRRTRNECGVGISAEIQRGPRRLSGRFFLKKSAADWCVLYDSMLF